MQNLVTVGAVHTHTHTHTLCLQDRENLNTLGLICIAPKLNINNKVDIQIKRLKNAC